MSILTIGYEGLDIENFLTLLRLGNVETVVDIRELPLSRKKGFSKNGLREILNTNGFAYQHISELGCPKSIRDQYRLDGDWQRYKKDFKRYLASQSEVISQLSEMAENAHCALLCFEANYRMCHRSLVADAVQHASGIEVEHLQASALKTEVPAIRHMKPALAGRTN
ncbi:DUF488 domain-containing protein [Massilia orientalis]|uniref:DUF488 family protein n=1 Tax=Massilia orientalis TaxID=3050128 RepID=A0ACC7MJP3_9BURK|nr:DUF488 domain-containing protein [Massilia sp. YIM B02787]